MTQTAYLDAERSAVHKMDKSMLDFTTRCSKTEVDLTNSNTTDNVLKMSQPEDAPESLSLSGRIICATVTIPYELYFNQGTREWDIRDRKGATAMYSGINHLQVDTKWDTILVSWTGEVTASESFTKESESEAESGPTHSNLKPTVHSAEVSLTTADKKQLEEQLRDLHGTQGSIVPVWMLEDSGEDCGSPETLENQGRWRKYADEAIWPLLHYKLWGDVTDGRQEKIWWRDYVKFNQAFADKIVSIYRPGDILFLHDFNLLLLPQLLRQRLPGCYIGFFLHAPFPSSEIFRCLPKRKEILAGLLGANMVAFQSFAYARHFISSCTRVLGFESTPAGVDAYGGHVSVETFAIGIDAKKLEAQCNAPGIYEKMALIRESFYDKKIIVGRDRLDEVRGVLQKLQAFQRLLDEFPVWRDKVVLIQVTSPSVHDTTKLERDVADLVAQINGNYGNLNFTPVHHYHQHLDQEEYLALLRVADVGLITSVRDGMNVTGLEYVIAQKGNNGPVLLSEFTGTAGSLIDAIQVNPWDSTGVAIAIDRALKMSLDERARRQSALYEYVTTHNVQRWTHSFVQRLLENLTSFDHGQMTPVLDSTRILETYRKAKRRLMCFDYDGTLTPIVREPTAAVPTDKVIRTLKRLAADPRNQIWIVSGRDQKFLEQWLGDIKELGLSAEHGSFRRHPKSDEWINLTASMNMDWQKDVQDVFQYFTERTQGSFVERKSVAVTWHYRKADPDYGAFQAKECQAHLEQTIVTKYPVEVLTGKANLEVRPKNINKGEIVKSLIQEYPEDAPPEFILCAGDDTTDEDMFKALRSFHSGNVNTESDRHKTVTSIQAEDIFSVTIGPSSKITLAAWHLLEPSDLIKTMGNLCGLGDGLDIAVPIGTVSNEKVN